MLVQIQPFQKLPPPAPPPLKSFHPSLRILARAAGSSSRNPLKQFAPGTAWPLRWCKHHKKIKNRQHRNRDPLRRTGSTRDSLSKKMIILGRIAGLGRLQSVLAQVKSTVAQSSPTTARHGAQAACNFFVKKAEGSHIVVSYSTRIT